MIGYLPVAWKIASACWNASLLKKFSFFWITATLAAIVAARVLARCSSCAAAALGALRGRLGSGHEADLGAVLVLDLSHDRRPVQQALRR